MGKLKVNSENILPIIKRWLYTEREIFLRELVSNAADALAKRKLLIDQGELSSGSAPRIDLLIDAESKRITIRDSGIGMTAQEVERYIAEVAVSGAEAFAERYQSANAGDQLIGHFGLGFFSAYMVADRVEIETLSALPESEPVHWSCEGGVDYTLEKGKREEIGTDVILHLNEESQEFLQVEEVRTLLRRYCGFLSTQIFVNGELLNEHPPLWIQAASECEDREYREFYQRLYPGAEEPKLWVHLQADYPFSLRGILYLPPLRREMELERGDVKLYCNRVFVASDCKELFPDFLLLMKGAIDSPDIPLNVSRSSLQVDRRVRQLGSYLAKKVADRLVTLYRTDRDQFIREWPHLELLIKLGAMRDEKFYERVKECLLFEDVQGEWKRVEEWVEGEEATKQLYYANRETATADLISLYREKGIPVLYAQPPLDAHLFAFLEQKIPGLEVKRIDGALDARLLDPAREETLLNAQGKTTTTLLAELAARALDDRVKVEAKSLASDELPAFLLLQEETRRFRDFLVLSRGGHSDSVQGMLKEKETLVLNTNSPLIQKLQELEVTKPAVAKELVQLIYDQARLSQGEMNPEEMKGYLTRSQKLLTQLVLA